MKLQTLYITLYKEFSKQYNHGDSHKLASSILEVISNNSAISMHPVEISNSQITEQLQNIIKDLSVVSNIINS